MKCRQGFVSNSSTCSFVVIGFVFNKKKIKNEDILKSVDYDRWKDVVESEEYKSLTEEDFEEGEAEFLFSDMLCDLDLFCADDEEDGAPKGKLMIGYEYVGDECSIKVYNLEEDLEKLQELKGKLEKYIPENASLKLVSGIRMC